MRHSSELYCSAPYFGSAGVAGITILVLFTLFSLFCTGYSDPGILPRRAPESNPERRPREAPLGLVELDLDSIPEPKKIRVKNVGLMDSKFCRTCKKPK